MIGVPMIVAWALCTTYGPAKGPTITACVPVKSHAKCVREAKHHRGYCSPTYRMDHLPNV